jgi:hypothetical protein
MNFGTDIDEIMKSDLSKEFIKKFGGRWEGAVPGNYLVWAKNKHYCWCHMHNIDFYNLLSDSLKKGINLLLDYDDTTDPDVFI